MATYNYIESSGTIIPDTSELLEEVNEEYRAIFGQDFITDPETPDGALIAAEATSRASVARNNAAIGNQLNPNLAGGIFLDAIWALTGGERSVATRSVVQATITGVAGTSVPPGSIARTTDGASFQSSGNITISLSGSAEGAFVSVEFGAIPASAGSLTEIVDSVLGWETITNPAAATLGSSVESDADARNRRRSTLALQGRSTAVAVTSNLRAVTGVRSLTFRENVLSVTDVIDGITLVAHSIWVSVDGGADLDVATAILEAKSAGSNWNGDQSVAVTEPASGQVFTVLFDRPDPVPLLMRFTVRTSTTQSTDPTVAIRSAVLLYANGQLEGEDGFVVGGDVSPFELSAAVGRRNPELFVTLVEIAFDVMSPVFVTTTLPIDIDQVATIAEADIQVLTP